MRTVNSNVTSLTSLSVVHSFQWSILFSSLSQKPQSPRLELQRPAVLSLRPHSSLGVYSPRHYRYRYILVIPREAVLVFDLGHSVRQVARGNGMTVAVTIAFDTIETGAEHPVLLGQLPPALFTQSGSRGGKRYCVGSTSHLIFIHFPVHCLASSPGDSELVCNRIPRSRLSLAELVPGF